jgi:hypothetical protein
MQNLNFPAHVSLYSNAFFLKTVISKSIIQLYELLTVVSMRIKMWQFMEELPYKQDVYSLLIELFLFSFVILPTM